MVFNAVFNGISVKCTYPCFPGVLSTIFFPSHWLLSHITIAAASAPIHDFLEYFLPILRSIFFPSHWLLSHITIVENLDRERNESCRNNYHQSSDRILTESGIEPATSCHLFSGPQRYRLSYGVRLKNIEQNGEIARYEQLLLFSQCFS